MSSLPLYDCKVGMRASDGPVVIHEARKLGVTAPEVIVLQTIHGDDLVTEIRHSNMTRHFPTKQERARLMLLYGEPKTKEALGSRSVPLPTELADAEPAIVRLEAEPEDDLPEIVEEEKPEPKPQMRSKKPITIG